LALAAPVAAAVVVTVPLAVAGPVVTPVPAAELLVLAVTWPVPVVVERPVLVRGSVEVTVAFWVRATVVSVWVADLVPVALSVLLCVARLVLVEVSARVPFVVPLGLTQSL
jgi:hypothetical protein